MFVSARGLRLRRWQLVSAVLAAVVGAGALVGWGVLGAWQGLTENPTNTVAAVTAAEYSSMRTFGWALATGSK